MRIRAGVALCALLGGCTLGPDFSTPDTPAAASFVRARELAAASQPVTEPVDAAWWERFGDPELTALEHRIAGENLSLRLALIRLAESRQQARIAGADALPQLNANGSYTRERLAPNGVAALIGGGGGAGGATGPTGASGSAGTGSNGLGGTMGGVPNKTSIPPFDLFQSGFDATWELDLWGRVRREREAAEATAEASAEAARDTLVSMQAEVARDYLQVRGTRTSLDIARKNLASQEQSLTLTRQRQVAGLTTDIDEANAEAQAAATSATIPTLEQQLARQVNALALLLGQPPGALDAELGVVRPVPPVPPEVPVGLPSELLRRRPDIRQAEAQLHSATADIGMARADFFPRVTLSGSIALQATQLKTLGSWGAVSYSAGPSVTIPVFEGGRLRATLELRKAQQREAATRYQQVVLQAFHDVDNALVAYAAEQRRVTALTREVAQARRAAGLARQRYAQGLTDFLTVLTADRTALQAEQDLSDSRARVATNLVAIYKALGGGFEGILPRQVTAAR